MSKNRKRKNKNIKHKNLIDKIKKRKHEQEIEDLRQFEENAEGKTP